MPADQAKFTPLALSRNGDWIASGDSDGVTRQWGSTTRLQPFLQGCFLHTKRRLGSGVLAGWRWLIAEVGGDDGKGHAIEAWSLKPGGNASETIVLTISRTA